MRSCAWPTCELNNISESAARHNIIVERVALSVSFVDEEDLDSSTEVQAEAGVEIIDLPQVFAHEGASSEIVARLCTVALVLLNVHPLDRVL